jgi:hypothetical protein
LTAPAVYKAPVPAQAIEAEIRRIEAESAVFAEQKMRPKVKAGALLRLAQGREFRYTRDTMLIRRGLLVPAFLVIFSLTAPPAGGLDFSSGAYGSIADYLRDLYGGADDNAGLTAFPVLNVPMGGRSEGMAGSFSAVADDSSFIEYNPAGSAVLPQSELAFFHNNWIADTRVEGAVYTFRRGDLGLAAGAKWLYTPFTEYNLYGDRVSKGYYSEAAGILNLSYTFFGGYYFSGLSAGLSLKGAFRFVPDYSSANDGDDYQGSPIAGSGRTQSAAMAMADLGLLSRFDLFKTYRGREKNISLALVLRNLGPPARGDPLPTAAVAALSYRPLRPLMVSFDFFIPLNLEEFSLSERPYWAAGISAQLTEFLSLRGGLLSKAGNLRITVGSAVLLERIGLEVNYSLDLLTQLQPLNRVSLGVRFDLGDNGRGERAMRVEALYLAGLNAYAREDFTAAWALWEDVLALNPRFDPAREGLDIIRRTLETQERIESLQRLD